MTQAAFNPFAGIDKAPPSTGGQYILQGNHILLVDACKIVNSQQGKARTLYVVETTVVESDNPEMKEGTTRSWVVNFDHQPALSNIRSFVAAAMNMPFDDVTEDHSMGTVSEANPLKGTVLKCEAFNIKTKGKGQDFTKVQWKNMEDDSE